MLDLINPKYSFRFRARSRGGIIFACLLALAATFIFPLVLGGSVGAFAYASGSLPIVITLLVALFFKDHLELAFIPLAINIALSCIRAVFDLSDFFPLDMSSLISLATLVCGAAFIGLLLLSLYSDIPAGIVQLCLIFFLCLCLVSTFFTDGNFTAFNKVISTPLQNLHIIIYLFLAISFEKHNNGLNIFAAIIAVLLCLAVSLILPILSRTAIKDAVDAGLINAGGGKSNYKYVTCDNCYGRGDVQEYHHCYECNGSGNVYRDCSNCNGNGTVTEQHWQECPDCRGNGTKTEFCSECYGDGCTYCAYTGTVDVNCWSCNGERGYFSEDPQICNYCNGNRHIPTICGNCEGDGKLYEYGECPVCDGEGKVRYYD